LTHAPAKATVLPTSRLGRRPNQPASPGKVVSARRCGSQEQLNGMRRPSVFGGFFIGGFGNFGRQDSRLPRSPLLRRSGADRFTLRIGRHSPELKRLYHSNSQSCGVFITAFNPFGQAQGDAQNEAAFARLGDELRTVSSCVINSEGLTPRACGLPKRAISRLASTQKRSAPSEDAGVRTLSSGLERRRRRS